MEALNDAAAVLMFDPQVFCTTNRKLQILHPDSCDDFESPNVLDVFSWWLQNASGAKLAVTDGIEDTLYHPDSCQPFQKFSKIDEGRFLGAILHNSNDNNRPASDWYGKKDRTSDLSAAFWAKSPAELATDTPRTEPILRVGRGHVKRDGGGQKKHKSENEKILQVVVASSLW
ncbi:hypothetical protein GUITHDRAFT_115728 [Guillardia theta CCMP2712]|uniref:Uncharacterized protein n=1 Tax=Guillardia theta (strain CCMP2712) TaxID=905079 RepID=L1IPJ0_GUITC|nr:hypothetical protein GUITHDRAFT_115728 [Guillardia theta CCMP2712]EKX38183.1 hypothetical protein GUITHDRAFT_115728 [Guillardia theta CCMP2712]|eukprot:XP_005825163.1 hypothetical protein GUITHDRAFT_115728 [Guillardia theta CCMP2712]